MNTISSFSLAHTFRVTLYKTNKPIKKSIQTGISPKVRTQAELLFLCLPKLYLPTTSKIQVKAFQINSALSHICLNISCKLIPTILVKFVSPNPLKEGEGAQHSFACPRIFVLVRESLQITCSEVASK